MNTEKIIKYTTPTEQVDKLKNQGLAFEDEQHAKEILREHGYYNIINSYKSPYIQTVNGCKRYKEGTTFEQINSMFILDHNLRNSIMAAMLDFEEHLRAITADVLANSFGTDHNNYLKWDNFRDRHVTIERFNLRSILSTLHQNIASGKDPIRYYREKYNVVPPWILFKGTYFSTLINFIRLFKNAQKQDLIEKLYSVNPDVSRLQCTKKLLSDTLFICLDYRNRAAHGGRIYNFETKHSSSLSTNTELFKVYPEFEHIKCSHGIAQLYYLLDSFAYNNPASMLNNIIDHEINRHLKIYPNDKTLLEEFMGLEIKSQIIVYTTQNSFKYHLDPTCSGIKEPQKNDIKKLDLTKYTPCKRCCKSIIEISN